MFSLNYQPSLPIDVNRRLLFSYKLDEKNPTQVNYLPKDIYCGAKLEINLSGYGDVTFASGTPAAKYGSVLASMLQNVSVIRGNDAFKSGNPELFHYENALKNKAFPVIRATAGATATNDPQADVTTVPYGTTTQKQNFNESMTVNFEFIHGKTDEEKFLTMLRTTSGPSVKLQITQYPYKNILDDANTAPIVYSNDNWYITVVLVEYIGARAQALNLAYDHRQEEITETFASKDSKIKNLPAYGALTSVIVIARDGAVGSAGSNTSKQLSDKVIDKLQLNINRKMLVDNTWRQIKDVVKSDFGVQFPKVASVARDDGMNGIFFIRNGLSSLQDISPGSAVNADLIIMSADPATGVDYTNKAFVRILVSQIAQVK